ncbi:SIR2 family NAD-dependent protein deacylase [Afifella marina]|uniref:protein acetyllysine N-acetyltransferase n=1 Tax=Afifella marina DSM 2698 TaxID=1120955 RepID=A0A1G5P6E0_AFIMA|nr:Sir2 family NAD-dependent protein deacetylase [Afifella marina]MBK1624816.1 NAD-dependent deacetylase [Afifella marina DSM 2698]MBK1628410.1 NAD-dependent deacetylase [Afifella marina]MBK5917897.1 NAD-dependent deacetylase [Afifella marina]RAI18762.1 NAD-dependent deacetylase [Afifella marina DSM 2698]SCZ45122.1 NAD-dependent deacetylase [Afifella marina DSM 2698]
MAQIQTDNDTLLGEAAHLQRLVDDAKAIVAFCGAGISTESGIPDFRSPGGIWSKMEPITYQEFMASEEVRLEDWRRRFMLDEIYSKAEPNIAHRVLAHLVAEGRSPGVVTQNVDGLHQRAGLSPEYLVELHGNATYAHCLDCREPFTLGEVRKMIEAKGESPRCPDCGGFIKSAIISFGEAMPEHEMRRAFELANECDLMIVLGSSLVVHPAATIPLFAKQSGARLVILNREETPLDDVADIRFSGEIGALLSALFPELSGGGQGKP